MQKTLNRCRLGDQGEARGRRAPSLCLLAGCKHRGDARLHLVAEALVRSETTQEGKAIAREMLGSARNAGERPVLSGFARGSLQSWPRRTPTSLPVQAFCDHAGAAAASNRGAAFHLDSRRPL
jgi:hypothetical protein